MTKEIRLNNIKIGNNNPIILIAGPCVIEGKDILFEIAENLLILSKKYNISVIFKSSYDKANRSSIKSYRGPGLEKGLDILIEIKKKYNMPILVDIHNTYEIEPASNVADIIQIPAFLCRQTDLIVQTAKKAKIINIKKGQFLSPYDVKNIIEKAEYAGNTNIIITERGVLFGYNNWVVDMRSFPIIRQMGYPVVFDATHSVQTPGGLGNSSGGKKEFILPLAKAAVATGIDGLFIETHPAPDKALSDGANMLPLNKLDNLLHNIVNLDKLIKNLEKESE